MTTHLPSKLALLAALLTSAAGCEMLNLGAPSDDPGYGDPGDGVGGGETKLPLLPLKTGNTWAYWVVAADGSKAVKYIIVKNQIMVGGTGLNQNAMAFAVHTTTGPMDRPSLITLQQSIGDRVVNYRADTFNAASQVTLDETWEPHQLEIDQSRTPGATWLETYTQTYHPIGAIPITTQQKEPWTVVGEEMVTLPDFPTTPFAAVVFQRGGATAVPPTTADGGTAGDAGRPPTLAAGGFSEAADAGATMPKTYWYTRGIGKIKEAGGGEPMEYLTYFVLP